MIILGSGVRFAKSNATIFCDIVILLIYTLWWRRAFTWFIILRWNSIFFTSFTIAININDLSWTVANSFDAFFRILWWLVILRTVHTFAIFHELLCTITLICFAVLKTQCWVWVRIMCTFFTRPIRFYSRCEIANRTWARFTVILCPCIWLAETTSTISF